jgi:hypothetical protein
LAFSVKVDNSSLTLSDLIGDKHASKEPKRKMGLFSSIKYTIKYTFSGFVRGFFARLADLGLAVREGFKDTKIFLWDLRLVNSLPKFSRFFPRKVRDTFGRRSMDLKSKAAAKLQPALVFIEKLRLRRGSGPTSTSAPSAIESAGSDGLPPSAESLSNTASKHKDDSALEIPAKSMTVTAERTDIQHVATGGTAFESGTGKTHGPSEPAKTKETSTQHVATGDTAVEPTSVEITVTTLCNHTTKQHGGMPTVNANGRATEVLRTYKSTTRMFRRFQKLPSLKGSRILRLRPKPRHRLPSKSDLNPFFFFSCTRTYTILVVISLYIAIFLIYLGVASAVARATCLEDYIPSPPLPRVVLRLDDYYRD